MSSKLTPSALFAGKSTLETIQELNTNVDGGLTLQDVEYRRKKYGLNELEQDEEEPLFVKFMDQLKQPLNLLLMGSAGVSLLMGQLDDAISIFAAILIVVTVAFVQEYRSEKSLEALNKLVPNYCHVMREGHLMTMLATELVPGDLVKFATGDRVPADVRLVKCAELEIDESNLTGETTPQRKTDALVTSSSGATISANERKNVAFMGTLVRAGNGAGVVVGTGKDTEFGCIWLMMKEVDDKKTPLQLKMEELGKYMSFASFGIIGVITLIGLAQGREWLDTFTIAVSLAVAAIPEGLPIVVTVTLALGVIRMSKKSVIIKRLPSVESLGSVNVICADKTGTLTKNEMTVTQIYTFQDGNLNLDHTANFQALMKRSTVRKLLQVATLCNNAHLRHGSDQEPAGQPTEIALLQMCQKFQFKDERETCRRLSEIPFGSEQKWMAVQCEVSGKAFHFVKGSADVILKMCRKFVASADSESEIYASQLGQDIQKQIDQVSHQLSHLGLRVIAFAYGVELNDLTFAGLAAMQDPPRDGIMESIHSLQTSGVKIVMITGDAKGTAMTIAKQLGILNSTFSSNGSLNTEDHPACLSGSQLDMYSDMELEKVVSDVCVYYRTTPKHKLQIVKALKAGGNVVAMTGDGVNDAPALKLADIGISMGKTGTDVSKEAADMILVTDDFSTILNAIEEGKSIYYNIRNFLRFQLSTSVSALTLIALSTLFRLPSPLNAMQILWINIIMDGPPAQSLGVEPVDKDVMKQPPRDRNVPMINRTLIVRILTSAAFVVGGTIYIYRSEMQDGAVTAKDTTMTFTTFVLFDMFNALSCRSESKSIFKIGFFTNKPFLYAVTASIVCQLFVIYIPFFQAIFQTVPLSFGELVKIVMLSSTVWLFDELRKYYYSVNSRKGYEMV